MLIERLLEENTDSSSTRFGVLNETEAIELEACIRCVKAITRKGSIGRKFAQACTAAMIAGIAESVLKPPISTKLLEELKRSLDA